MKVKIIGSNFMNSLEAKINDFIKDKIVKDIKYQYYNNYFTCLIIYEEK